MKKLTVLTALCMAIVLCLFLGAQAPEMKPNFDSFVPENVYVYYSIDDMARVSDVIEKSFINNLWNDPEVKKFTDKAMELIQKEFEKEVTAKTQISLKEITSALGTVFSGQVAFILDTIELKTGTKKVTKYEWDEEADDYVKKEVEVEDITPVPHVVFLARAGSNKEALDNLIDKICTQLTEKEIYKKADEYKKVSYFTFYEKKVSLNVSYGYMDDIFFLAYGEKGFKKVIDNYKGEGANKSLNTVASYKKIVAEIGEERLQTFFVNVSPLVVMLKQWIVKENMKYGSTSPEAIDELNKTVEKVIELTGLGDLKSLAGSSRFEGDGMVGFTYLDIPGAKRGIWKILSSSATAEFNTMKAVPKETLLYLGMAVSPTEIYDEVMDVLSKVVPKEEFDMMMKEMQSGEEEIGLKIKDDIIGAFGSEFAILEDLPNAGKADPMDLTSFFPMKIAIIGNIKQADKFKKAHDQVVKKIFAEGGFVSLKEKDYNGVTLHIVESNFGGGGMGMEEDEGEAPAGKELAGYFFTNDTFVFAFPADYLRTVADALAGKNKGSLLADADFAKILIKNKIDANKTFVSYMDWVKYVELMENLFNKVSEMNKRFQKPKDPGPEEELLKLMPKIETIKKHLAGLKSFGQFYPVKDGFMSRDYIRLISE
ncbi:MAG: hypothetical protein HY811_05635 [Planctomycetes bacterium]|nr:hypothetical protein [Planctomycetota bacterium]